MLELIRGFIKDEEGMGTVEVVIIIAILVGVALIFRNQIIAFTTKLMGNVFNDGISDKVDPQKIETTSPPR